MKTTTSWRTAVCVAVALATLAGTHPARANQIDWANTGSDFNTGGNWIGGMAPGTGDIAEFNSAKVFDPNLSASLTIQGLNFEAVSGYTLSGDPGTALTLTNTGVNDTAQTSAVRGSNTSGTNTISADLILGGVAGNQQSISQKAGGTLVINGTLTNTNAITALRLGGGGIIDLTADNSATLNAPVRLATDTTLQIGNDNALGTGQLAVVGSGATIQSDSSTDRVLTNSILISNNNTTFGAGGNLTFGAMTQDGDQTIVVNNAITTVASLGSDTTAARNLTKEGAGALLVTGNRTEGGVTKITAGTFGVAGSFTSQNINLNGGVLALNNTGLGGSFTRSLGTTTSTVRWTDSGGFAAYGANPAWGAANNLTVNIGGAGATLTWDSTADFLDNGQTLILGSTVSNGTVDFQNALNFGASNQTIQTNRGTSAPTGGVDAVLSGLIGSSGGGFTKTGDGTLQLTANNTYTGTTTVNAGILLVNGNQSAATGAVTVNSGATLGGSGIIGGTVTVNAGGTLAPGNSTGILTTASLSLNSSSNFVLELNNTVPGTGYDQLLVNGTVTLNLGDIVVLAGAGLNIGDTFYVVLNDGSDAVSGTFVQGATVTSGFYTFSINYADNGDAGGVANDISLTVTAVPEPQTWALLIAGLVMLAALRKRFRRAAMLTTIAFTAVISARGDEISWANTGSDFNTGGSWVGGMVPSTADIATFDTAKVFDPNLSASLTIEGLFFDMVSGYTLTGDPGATLTLTQNGSGDTAGTSAVRGNHNSGTNIIDANLILSGNPTFQQSFSQASGGELIFNGTITSASAIPSLRLGGTGTIELNADNSATLNVEIRLTAGTTLQIGNNNALGTGLLFVAGGNATIQSNSAVDRVLPNDIFISENNTTFGPGGNLTFGAMTQDGNQTLIVANEIVTVASLSSNNAGVTRNLTKEGTGALLVSGNRTDGGVTKITGGTFGVAGSFTSENIDLNGGVLALNDAALGGSFTRSLGTTATTVRWTDSGGFAAYGSDLAWGAANNLTVNIGGAGATLTWGTTTNFLASGETLILGSAASNGTVDFQNGLDFGASNQTVQVNRGATAPVGGVDAKISGVLAGSAVGFTKTGDGTLDLTANNTYTGTTTVNAGTLLVDGNQSAATGAVTVNSGATLGGSGIIGGTVTVNSGGTLAPGNSTGILTTASLSLNSSSNFVLELNNTVPGTGYDQLLVNGTITLNLGDIVVLAGAGLNIGDTFYVVLNDGSDAVSGTFVQGATVTSGFYTFTINYADNGDGGGVANDISLTVTAVPEPQTWALLLCGFAALVFLQRTMRRSRIVG